MELHLPDKNMADKELHLPNMELHLPNKELHLPNMELHLQNMELHLPLFVFLLPFRHLLHPHLLNFRRLRLATGDVELVVADTQVENGLVDARLYCEEGEILGEWVLGISYYL